MALARMKKVEIFSLQDQRDSLLKILQETAVLEITEYHKTNDAEDEFTPRTISEVSQVNGELENRIAEIGRALLFLEHLAPVKPSIVEQFAGIKTYLTPEQFQKYLGETERLEKVLQELNHSETELGQIQVKRNQLQTTIQALQPWEALDLSPEALAGSATIQVVLGTSPYPAGEIQDLLAELEEPVYFEVVNQTNQSTFFVFIFEKVYANTVLHQLSQVNLATVILPPYETTVGIKINELKAEIEKLTLLETKIRNQVIARVDARPLLQVFYDSLINERYLNEEAAKLIYSDRSWGLSGWILEDQISKLQERLNQKNFQYALVVKEPAEGEEAPIVLQNNQALSPFEYLVQSFSYPKSRDVDPTPLIAPFFFIFFGIALGDAGYGLILSLICAVLLVKLKMGPVGKKLGWMFLVSGFGAVLAGLLTGSFFSIENLNFGLFNPIENPILLLGIALALGLIQLYLGVIVSAWNNIKAGRWSDVIWNQGFWLLFLTSVLLVLGKDALGLSLFSTPIIYVLLIACLGLIIGNTRGKKGIIAKLIAIPGGLLTIYGSVGFFSDVLSYSRLMALGLSGGVMGGIMNQLAWMVIEGVSVPVVGWVFGIIILLLGHTLNLALSVLGAYVHSSRLQYLEFFGKFYEGGGRPFIPFKSKPKYTFLINEREAN